MNLATPKWDAGCWSPRPLPPKSELERERERDREDLHLLVHPQMAAKAKARPGWSMQHHLGPSTVRQGPKYLGHLLVLFPEHQQGAGFKME